MYRILLTGLLCVFHFHAVGQEMPQNKKAALLETNSAEFQTDAEAASAASSVVKRKKIAKSIVSEGKVNLDQIEAMVQEFRADLLLKVYFDQFLKDAVSDADVKSYYDSHSDEFTRNEINIAHIFIKASEPDKKKLAKDIAERLSKGEIFGQLAAEYSQDTVSAAKGGELGWVADGYLNKKFSQTIFSMEKEQLSEPFSTQEGIHIVKILEPPRSITIPFEQVQAKIREELTQQARQQEIKRLANL